MTFFKFFILGILTSLIYPPFFLFPLGFIVFPYLLSLVLKVIPKNNYLHLFSFGFSFGLGFLLVYLSWIGNPFLFFEETKPYVFLSILLPVFLSIFFGLGFCIYNLFTSPKLIILISPVIFVFIEFSISNFLYGFPWITNSIILSNNLVGLYLLKFYGTLSSGYLILSIFLIPSFILIKNKTKKFNSIILLIYLPFIIFLLIPFNHYYKKNEIFKEIYIEANQIFTPLNYEHDKKIEKKILKKIDNSESDLIVFAENNLPFSSFENNYNKINSFLNKNKKVIIGTTTLREGKYYNSFLLFEKNKLHVFDKKILVPFGEFLPFRKYLKFMKYISGSIDFEKGNTERLIVTKDEIKILPIICYEIVFDTIFKKIDHNNIDIMINITNDSWFGNKIGPYQHLYISRMKSLIANKPLLRVSNNGISALITNYGEIIKFTELNKVSSFSHKVEIKNNTSYVNYHILFSYYLLVIFLLFLLFERKILK